MTKDARGRCLFAITAASLWLAAGATFAREPTAHDLCREVPPAARSDCRAAADLLAQAPASPDADLTVRITAQADRLRYRYETTDPSASRDCEGGHLVLPAAGRVRLLVTSDDTIYAWRVPALGMSVDLVPGRVNERLLDRARVGMVSAPGTLRNETSGREMAADVRLLRDDGASLHPRILCEG